MKIKELPKDKLLTGVRFRHPQTGETCIWVSQWGYPDGKAGVWYKTAESDTRVNPLLLDNLKEALEFEIMEDGGKA